MKTNFNYQYGKTLQLLLNGMMEEWKNGSQA